MITYKFKSLTRKDLKPQDLIKYLEEKLQIEGRMPNIAEIVTKTVQTVTPRCLAFEFPEIYLKKIETVQHEQHPDFEIIRVSTISQLKNEQVQDDD